MSVRFVNLDRHTPMFLPCDLREWLPAEHLVHFLLDAVEQIPTGHFHVNHRGTGSEQYPPTRRSEVEVERRLWHRALRRSFVNLDSTDANRREHHTASAVSDRVRPWGGGSSLERG